MKRIFAICAIIVVCTATLSGYAQSDGDDLGKRLEHFERATKQMEIIGTQSEILKKYHEMYLQGHKFSSFEISLITYYVESYLLSVITNGMEMIYVSEDAETDTFTTAIRIYTYFTELKEACSKGEYKEESLLQELMRFIE